MCVCLRRVSGGGATAGRRVPKRLGGPGTSLEERHQSRALEGEGICHLEGWAGLPETGCHAGCVGRPGQWESGQTSWSRVRDPLGHFCEVPLTLG